jgi:hypothetical protein
MIQIEVWQILLLLSLTAYLFHNLGRRTERQKAMWFSEMLTECFAKEFFPNDPDGMLKVFSTVTSRAPEVLVDTLRQK